MKSINLSVRVNNGADVADVLRTLAILIDNGDLNVDEPDGTVFYGLGVDHGEVESLEVVDERPKCECDYTDSFCPVHNNEE